MYIYVTTEKSNGVAVDRRCKSGCRARAARVDSRQTGGFTIRVNGGGAEQQIDNIYLKICCQYFAELEKRKGGDEGTVTEKVKKTCSLSQWSLPETFIIAPGEERIFNAGFILPLNTPITLGEGKVWLETGLDIQFAIDPTDTDMLVVRPDALMAGLFDGLTNSGLQLRQAECEAATGFELPFVQEFEFVPVSGTFLAAGGSWKSLPGVMINSLNCGLQWIVNNGVCMACYPGCSVGVNCIDIWKWRWILRQKHWLNR